MGLSEHEQRVLEEMERAFYQEDPRFATNIRGDKLDRPRGRRAPLMTLLAVAGLFAMIFGVALPQPWLGVAGFAAVLFGLYGVLEAALGNRADRPGRERKSRRSWTDRAAERFERRQDGD